MFESSVVEEIDDESSLLIRRRVEDLPEAHRSQLTEGMSRRGWHRHAVQIPVGVPLDRVGVARGKANLGFLSGRMGER